MRISDWSSDVCSSDLAADLRLVAYAAEAHAHEIAAGGPGDRLAERGLADARRADQAKDRSLDLLHALLNREIFENPLLDLLQAIVVGVEHLLGELDVALDLRRLAPRNAQHPVEIVADHRRLGRHRAPGAQLLRSEEHTSELQSP